WSADADLPPQSVVGLQSQTARSGDEFLGRQLQWGTVGPREGSSVHPNGHRAATRGARALRRDLSAVRAARAGVPAAPRALVSLAVRVAHRAPVARFAISSIASVCSVEIVRSEEHTSE